MPTRNLLGSSRDITHQQSNADADSHPDLSVSVGLRNRLEQSISLLAQPGFSSPNGRRRSDDEPFLPPDLSGGGRLYPLLSPFGTGLLLSDVEGAAVVSAAAGAAETDVAHSVFASVLNASQVLEPSRSGAEEYYFLKGEEGAFSTDYQEMQRLSGSYNVSVESLRPSGRQLCASASGADGAKVCLVYGAERRAASRHLLRAAFKQATEAAWRREAQAARAGLPTAQKFTPQQRAELSKRGTLRGLQPTEARGPHKFPELIGHPSNVVFVRDSEMETNRFHSEKGRGRND